MQQKNNLPNCRLFDTYFMGIPNGAVQCFDSSNCEHCGFNPKVTKARLLKFKRQQLEKQFLDKICYRKNLKGEKTI